MSELKPIDECTTVAELLAERSRWTQHANARDAHGNPIDPTSERAASFCVLGAIRRTTGRAAAGSDQLRKLCRLLDQAWPSAFNDTRTYEEVYAKVLEAGI